MSTIEAKPAPTYLPKRTVEDFAESTASHVGYVPGTTIEAVVNRLGGRVEIGTTSSKVQDSGSLLARGMNDFVIYVSSFTSRKRDAFTIAHELGHLFLHYPKVQKDSPGAIMKAMRWVDNDDKSAQRAEWEANWFAAGFLMPRESFSQAYEKGIEHVAASFGVSRLAAEIRAKSLGLSE